MYTHFSLIAIMYTSDVKWFLHIWNNLYFRFRPRVSLIPHWKTQYILKRHQCQRFSPLCHTLRILQHMQTEFFNQVFNCLNILRIFFQAASGDTLHDVCHWDKHTGFKNEVCFIFTLAEFVQLFRSTDCSYHRPQQTGTSARSPGPEG